ncbi:hypothetical protein MNEG_10710, partial [Monoraphidium neglectum]
RRRPPDRERCVAAAWRDSAGGGPREAKTTAGSNRQLEHTVRRRSKASAGRTL